MHGIGDPQSYHTLTLASARGIRFTGAMLQATPDLLHDLWYLAVPGHRIARGKTQPITLLGKTLLVGRDAQGAVFAMLDFCPHRGIPLSYGTFDGTTIECCYHGWCFDTQGVCTKIPSLTEDDKVEPGKIKAKHYPAREIEGNIWIFMHDGKVPETLPEPPAIPGPASKQFFHVDSVLFPCPIDDAVIGLMDPSHGPFVHKSWWWRTRKSIHLKEKSFEPMGLGFRMMPHKPSSNSRAYKILGGGLETQISFSLPGLRTEHIRAGRHHIVLLTALTPVDAKNTMLHQFFYTSSGFVNLLKWLALPFGKAFIRQDLDIVVKQQRGLNQPDHPPLLLLGAADQQALWYYKLKRAYLAAQAETVPFENTLRAKTLRWRS